MSTFENNIKAINKLLDRLNERVSEEDCLAYFRLQFDQHDSVRNKNFYRNHWSKSKGRILLQVSERLTTCEALIEDIERDMDFLRRYKYPSIGLYLKLTCFDQLGQPGEWMTFDNWLNSKKKKEERAKIVEGIRPRKRTEFAKELYLAYQKVYGVKNSFFRFINDILPSQSRARLLEGIEINIHLSDKKDILSSYNVKEASELDKIGYLYKVRNDFTHNVFSATTIYEIDKDEHEEDKMCFREKFYKGRFEYSVYFYQDFDQLLTETIYDGIAAIILDEVGE